MKNIISLIKSNYKAWLTVAMINIPLSISLAVASWATPTQWLITWIWASIIASLFASSNYNIYWVAWALASILLWFVLSYENWVSLLPILAIVTWFIIFFIYIFKIVKYITLIPITVLHGFLISVWIIIALTQLVPAFWLNDPSLAIPTHKEIYLNIYEIYKNISLISIDSFIVFLFWVIFLLFVKRYKKFPWVIFVTLVWILIWYLSQNWLIPLKLLVLSEKYPEVGFSIFQNPFNTIFFIDLKLFFDIIKISIFIAIIAILETIISAKIREKITKEKFKKNKEVLGLSLSNIWSWVMWWLPVSRVFVRTALNIESKANHKISWFLTWFFTFLIALLLFNDFFKYLPFPIISAILFTIAIWLIDLHLLRNTYKIEKTAFFIMIITTLVSIIEDATFWILLWTFLALIIFIKRISSWILCVSIFNKWDFIQKISLKKFIDSDQNIWDILIIKFRWTINFLNIESILENISLINNNKKVILSFSSVWDIDLDWLERIEEIISIFDYKNIDYYITWVNKEITLFLEKKDFFNKLKEKNKVFVSSSLVLNNLKNESI